MNQMDKSLILFRGIPGCGKSTLASLLMQWEGAICTADDFHMRNGNYEWKAENAAKAHLECRRKCQDLMKNGIYLIAVANTNTTMKEMQPYYDLAEKYGYRVYSVVVENRHDGVNEHNVPEVTLQAMKDRFDIKL
jgi:predicted kinase